MAQVDTLIAHKLTVQSDIENIRRNLKGPLPSQIRYANQELGLEGVAPRTGCRASVGVKHGGAEVSDH